METTLEVTVCSVNNGKVINTRRKVPGGATQLYTVSGLVCSAACCYKVGWYSIFFVFLLTIYYSFFFTLFNTSHYLEYSTLHYITLLTLLCITFHRVTQAYYVTHFLIIHYLHYTLQPNYDTCDNLVQSLGIHTCLKRARLI